MSTRESTRAQGLKRIRKELAAAGYAVRECQVDGRPYLLAERPGQRNLYSVRVSSHDSGLVVTGNDDDQWTARLQKHAAACGAAPRVIAHSTATGTTGEQAARPYRSAVIAGEKQYLLAGPGRTRCLYAHGPDFMNRVA